MNKVPHPSEITRTCWASVLGMTEMEEAAKVLVAKCQAAGDWRPVKLEDFSDGMEKNGFLELIYHGWLGKSHPAYENPAMMHEPIPPEALLLYFITSKGCFFPTRALLERITSRPELFPTPSTNENGASPKTDPVVDGDAPVT